MRKAFKKKRRWATVNITVKAPPLSGLLQDPAFTKAFEEWTASMLTLEQYHAKIAP